MKKNKIYLLTLAAGVFLIVLALVSKGGDKGPDLASGDEKEEVEESVLGENDEQEEVIKSEESSAVGNVLYGVLNSSDNQARGNVKLVSNLGYIYMKTTKDFTSLFGKEVAVSIDGTLESFRLVDIKAK